MKSWLKLLTIVACVAGLVVPGVYFWLAADLPPLGTREDAARVLAIALEQAREAELRGNDGLDMGRYSPRPKQPLLGPADLAPAVLHAQLAADGCPDYLAVPEEGGAPWAIRVVSFAASGGLGAPGPGRCRLLYAERLAATLGVPEGGRRAIAAHRLRGALGREELLAAYLSAAYFDTATYGVADASARLFGKAPSALDAARAAELRLAQNGFGELFRCKNPQQLRARRDRLVDAMAAFAGVTEAEAKAAKAQPLSCEREEGTRRSR